VADAAPSFTSSPRFRALIGVVVLVAIGIGIWRFMVRGQESTDDAQVDGSVTLIAARVGGTVQTMHVVDHQAVQSGEILVELDPREYQIAVDKARAELADAEASAVAAQNAVPITSTTTASTVVSAQGALDSARAVMAATDKEVDAARARLAAVEAREREARANATKAARDVERLKGLLAKDEISQQQFDAATSAADATKASTEAARAQVVEVEAAIRVAESRLVQARASESQATAALETARTAPEQVAATRSRHVGPGPRRPGARLARSGRAQSAARHDQGAGRRRGRPQVGESRSSDSGRAAAAVARPGRRGVGDRQLQGDAACPYAARTACHRRGRRLRRT